MSFILKLFWVKKTLFKQPCFIKKYKKIIIFSHLKPYDPILFLILLLFRSYRNTISLTIKHSIKLVKKFDGEYPKRFEKELFEYLSLPKNDFLKASKNFEKPIFNKEYFELLTDNFRSPHLWFFQKNVKYPEIHKKLHLEYCI